MPCNVQSKAKKPCDDEIIHETQQTIVTKEETTWQSITEDIDCASEYIDASSQSMLLLGTTL